jgi:hypothetical protein
VVCGGTVCYLRKILWEMQLFSIITLIPIDLHQNSITLKIYFKKIGIELQNAEFNLSVQTPFKMLLYLDPLISDMVLH